MGKKSKSKPSKQKISSSSMMPNVSICTPTFNRRPFFQGLISCIAAQDYPREKMEWVVLDDGTDCVRDIIESDECKEKLKGIKVVYHYEKEKMDLGKKRNAMHQQCTFKKDSDIIVYMDDDDYYPITRVSHSVKKLVSDPKVLCGGSSELYLWFNSLDKMYKFGPYGPNHATAGTFAFKRVLLSQTHYEDAAVLAEERHFLKNYTVPFVQFDPMQTILVVAHEQNTFDKKRLVNKDNKFCHDSSLRVEHFIKDKSLCQFYDTKINELLKDYEPGDVKNKPKVLEEIKRRDTERLQQAENRPSGIIVSANGQQKELTVMEVQKHMQAQHDLAKQMHDKNTELVDKCKMFQQQNQSLQARNHKLQQQITEICLKMFNHCDLSNTELKEAMPSILLNLKNDNEKNEHVVRVSIKDVETVMRETSCTQQKAAETLAKHNNNVVNAMNEIMNTNHSNQRIVNVNPKDVEVIVSQTSCTQQKAVEMLAKHNNDVVDAILEIQNDGNNMDNKGIDEKDVQIVISQTMCTKEKATEMLTKHNNDVVDAIMEIQNEENKEVKENTETNDDISSTSA
uniref:Glycosyltransferase 2-like domain-containing protein n=1 Tax=viral metagenome TaxID=1070528 RepID=A0A6C0KLH3_9ZZZZ